MTKKMSEEHLKYELLQPWSSFILKTKLPKNILKKMIKLTDRVIFDPKSVSWGPNLAGQIELELNIDLKLIEKTDIEKYFYGAIEQYCIRAHLQTHPPYFDSPPPLTEYLINVMWIISQKDNEYNPAHIHSNCTLSAIMYLKIPKFLPSRKPKEETDGNIVFTSSPRNPSGVFGNIGVLTLKPEVGDFFIFPAEQMHQVYPFRTVDGRGERRSVSFNVRCQRNKEQYEEWDRREHEKSLVGHSSKKIKKY